MVNEEYEAQQALEKRILRLEECVTVLARRVDDLLDVAKDTTSTMALLAAKVGAKEGENNAPTDPAA